MSSTFRNTAAILAILVGMGGTAMAQTAPASPPAPAAPVEITEDTLPDLLKGLNLQNIDIDRDRRHTEVEGDMADGTQIEAVLDDRGQLRKIEADDDAPLPAAVIEALVPQAVRDAEMYGQFASINEIGLAPADAPMQGVMIEGLDANGEEVRALFGEDGTLTRFGRGDDDRHDRRGDRGGKHGMRGFHGDHGDHGKQGERGGPRDMQGADGGPGAGRDGGQPPAMLDAVSVTRILTDAGYDDLGAMTQDGPRTLVEAVNAAGENVTVELTPRGEVVRETAR